MRSPRRVGSFPTEHLLCGRGAVRCFLEAQSVCHLVLSTWASWACKGGPDLPSSYLGALSHPHPMTETILLPHGDTRDPGPVAAAQPPALPLSRITPEVKSWRVPHLPVAVAALLPHRLPSCTVLGVSTSNPGLWALLHAGRCSARRKENDHGEKQTDQQAEDRLGLAGDPRLVGLPRVWVEAP